MCLYVCADRVSRELHPLGKGQTCSSMTVKLVLLSHQR